MLSGLNLGLFSLGKLELQVEAKKGNPKAKKVLKIRDDANFALVTILWGNVGVNVLLALLSGSVMAGVAAFVFSTVVITIFAEIIPQSYFSRNALEMSSRLAPLLRFYQIVFYPVAKPTALVLDRWLGGDMVRYFREKDLRQLIKIHMDSSESDIAKVEGQGALNFLDIDDVPMFQEGEDIDPDSIIEIEFKGRAPVFPEIKRDINDPFLKKVNKSGKSWIVLIDGEQEPRLVFKSDEFTRDALFGKGDFKPTHHCHRPIVITDSSKKLGNILRMFKAKPGKAEDDILEDDVILLWNGYRRLVTGPDILGRLLRGIVNPA